MFRGVLYSLVHRIGPGDYESGLIMGAPYSYTPKIHDIKTFEKHYM